MEVTVGVQNMPRELVLDIDAGEAESLSRKLSAALSSQGLLELKDTRGRTVIVPAQAVGYLEVGPEETRRVGFGSL